MKLNWIISSIINLLYHIKVVYNFNYFNKFSLLPDGAPPIFPPSCGYTIQPCLSSQWFRRFDGSCSNPHFPNWGVAGSKYLYLIEPIFEDGFSLPQTTSGGRLLPNARIIRNTFFPDGEVSDKQYNVLCMTWGQFVIHDLSLMMDPIDLPTCCDNNDKFQNNMGSECFAYQIPKIDRMSIDEGISCVNLTRAQTDYSIGCHVGRTAKPLNTVTAALDLSQVYGLQVSGLRTFRNGLLKSIFINGVELPPISKPTRPDCEYDFLTGDRRANQNMHLTSVQNIFLKEHNRLAKNLHFINPHWKDQRLFMEARRIAIAIFQRITYYEWLTTRISEEILYKADVLFNTEYHVDDFTPSINLSPSSEFSHACSRYFHTNIPNDFQLYDADRNIIGTINVADNIFCQTNLTKPNFLAQSNVGLITQAMSSTDAHHAESITQFFDRLPGKVYGTDLRSIDILRGRDIGLASYTAYRSLCNVGPSNTFEDLSDFFSSSTISKLKGLFKRPADIDLSTGGSLEKHLPGSHVGPTFLCIIIDQFRRTRQGDLFFHEHPQAAFTQDQLTAIRETSTVAKLFCNNADGIDKIQERALELVDELTNPLIDCDLLPDIDLSLWKEFI